MGGIPDDKLRMMFEKFDFDQNKELDTKELEEFLGEIR